jgi:hypothetical protein
MDCPETVWRLSACRQPRRDQRSGVGRAAHNNRSVCGPSTYGHQRRLLTRGSGGWFLPYRPFVTSGLLRSSHHLYCPFNEDLIIGLSELGLYRA